MKCYHCCRTVPIDEDGFPEDLYNLIHKYNINQLLWICKHCKEGTDLTSCVSQLSDGQKRIDGKLTDLAESVRLLTDEVRNQSRSFPSSNISSLSFDGTGDQSNSSASNDADMFFSDKIDVRNQFHSMLTRDILFGTNKLDGSACDDASKISTDEFKVRNQSLSLSSVTNRTSVDGNKVNNGAHNNVARFDSFSETSSMKSMKVSTPTSPKDSSALPLIQAILNSTKIRKEEESTCKQFINSVLNNLLESLKKDPDFSCLYKTNYYTGSAYNDLRITSATEFDINLVLRVPSKVTLTPEFFDETFAFVKLKVNHSSGLEVPVKRFIDYCSSDGYLSPEKVSSWLQRHVDSVLREGLEYPEGVLNVTSVQSGPAKTLLITTAPGYSISVDLVPVFEFDFSTLARTAFYNSLLQISKETAKQKWFVVPKGCVGEIDLKLSDTKQSWRFDFPEAEKSVLHNKHCAKPIIKMLKLLRDKQNWKDLASYYLKTVVLLKILENPFNTFNYWNSSVLYDRFLEVLKKLKGHLDDQNLPHFITGTNLFHKMNKIQCSNWSNYLQKLISSVESDPKALSNFFL